MRYSARELPIHPYVLGAWIGDGTKTSAEITCEDEGILREIEACGYPVARQRTRRLRYRVGGTGHTRDELTGQMTQNDSLSSTLRWTGLLGQKLIPNDYLQASVEQREALLAGLMDTDGYVDTFGRCDITTIDDRLADQYAELIASLGFRPTIARKRADA